MICSKCGGSGPFPAIRRGNQCSACLAAYQRRRRQQNRPYNPEANAVRQRRWRKNHPIAAAQIAGRNYRKRKASGKIDAWKQANKRK